MTTHTALLAGPSASRSAMRDEAPILIRVPSLERPQRAASRPSVRPRRAGRRLRREVRVAASALLFALPMSWALLSFPKFGPDASGGRPSAPSVVAGAPSALDGDHEADDFEGPRVTITLASSAGPHASATVRDLPRVVPAGFLLPDDGSEDWAHAGN